MDSNHIQNFNYIPHLICEILSFKEPYILTGVKFLHHNARTWFFEEKVFAEN